MGLFPRPCLNCKRLTRNGPRCEACTRGVEATRDAKRGPRQHYKGEWPRIARAAIAAHPYCAECGATKDLTADHVVPRSLSGGVRVLCRPCNSRKKDRTA